MRKKLSDAGFRPTPNTSNNNELTKNKALLVPGGIYEQGSLFHVEKQVEKDGIEMGVLENGVPYLSESGLARMCGVDRKVLNRLAINWQEEKKKDRGMAISNLLEESGYTDGELYLKSEHNGAIVMPSRTHIYFKLGHYQLGWGTAYSA